MANTEAERTSTFYADVVEDMPIRRLTETGTLFTDVGNSQFFHPHKRKDSVERKRSLTGSTVTQAGASHFYSKPPLAELAYTPPNIITKDTKPLRNLTKSRTVKFPQLKEFAHFHYNKVNIGQIQSYIDAEKRVGEDGCYDVVVESKGSTWVVQRSLEHFILLDRQIHYCVFDRKYSKLPDLETAVLNMPQNPIALLSQFLERFSSLSGNNINCGTVLNFFELNSVGGRLISPATDSAINIPAIAAALVTKAYHACDIDELELKEGDLISVIDKPPSNESSWWRGKKELMVGFFPSECVELISSNRKSSAISVNSATVLEQLPVLRTRDKLIAFLRQFFLHRPARNQLKQSGIVKELVFGTDLGEYLTNSALLLPRILTCCCEAIERHGLIDGIYRLSGRATQVQQLREDFDLDRHQSFSDDDLLDIHTVSTLLKTYFRELPNPLLTYQLYDALVSCVQLRQTRKQLVSLKSHIVTLPPTHYRTAKFLFAHLSRLSVYSKRTSMTSRNLAIVWAPNLIRYDESTGTLNAFALLQNVSLQAAVTDLMICNYDFIFNDSVVESSPTFGRKPQVLPLSARLLSLSVARKKKGDMGRACNSSSDNQLVDNDNLQSDTKCDKHPKSYPCHLVRSHSLSLDSVFANSTSGKVHLLSGPGSDKVSTLRGSSPEFERAPLVEASADIPTSSSVRSSRPTSVAAAGDARDVVSTNMGSLNREVAHTVKPAPMPKPRQNRMVHDYVNVQAVNQISVQRSDGKPVPAVRTVSPKPVRKRLGIQRSNKVISENSRPSTTHYGDETTVTHYARPFSLATDRMHISSYQSNHAERESSHYAVSDICFDVKDRAVEDSPSDECGTPLCGMPTIAETGISRFCDGSTQPHNYMNIAHRRGNSVDSDRVEEDNTDDDYESTIEDYRSSQSSYVNVHISPSHPVHSSSGGDNKVHSLTVNSLNPHPSLNLSFSNPLSSDHDVIRKCMSSSLDSPSP